VKKILILALVLLPLLFVAYEVLLFIDNYANPGRMRETPVVRPHEKEILIMEQGLVPAAGGEAFYRAIPANELRSPFQAPDTGVITAGKNLYLIYCAQCHGQNYDGNGTVGQSFAPLPTDLRSAKVQSMLAGKIFKDISYGVPKGRQPALDTTIDITDRWRIIAFVQSLGLRE
jgi:mono/diheme cytochrome c family protein